MVASFLGALGSFGLNQLSSAIGSSRQARNTKKVMSYQDELNRAFTRDSYGIMREGLEKAGYNPLLALGSSANQANYNGSASLSDSDIGTEAVNSALEARRLKNENKLNEATLDKLTEEKKGIELDNQLKQANLDTNPKKVISDIVSDKANNTLNYIKNKLGIDNSSKKSVKSNNQQIRINLSDNKPYVQKGVPRSVVKKFENMNSNSAVKSQKNNSQLGIWNSSRKLYGSILSDLEAKKYLSRKFNGSFNKPPKYFPSGM